MARWPSGSGRGLQNRAGRFNSDTGLLYRSVAQWKSTALRRQVSLVQIQSGLSDNPYKFGRRIPNWIDADEWCKEHGFPL